MNILLVGHEKNLNGATLSLLGIIDELANENNIFVLTPDKEGNFVNELKKRNVNIIYSNYYWWMLNESPNKYKWKVKKILYPFICGINYISAVKIRKIVLKNNIDIIHTNTSVINMGAIISRICKKPHIWHIREFGTEDFDFHYVYPQSYIYKYINNNSTFVVTVSNALKEKFKKYIAEEKIVPIYNGVNEKNFQVKKFNLKKKSIDMIICSRLEEAKGQKEAILAINELVRRGYKNISLKMAGAGDQTELKKIICDLKLEDYIKLMGRVENLVEIRKNIDIELVCSRCEAFGRVTIEAMMGMIPVIGANTGGTKELIKDGVNGYLYEQGNYMDLADKIQILIDDRSQIEKMGKEAYKYSKEFTSKRNASQIYKLYEKAVNLE